MNKTLKKILIGVGILVVVLFIAFKFMQYNTKKASPEATATYSNGVNITVKYCKPSKRGREIFGKLEPFGKVWRTGANEATTFDTDNDLTIGDKVLPAGHYTLWTIPEKESWTVIFNKKDYMWGVNQDGASREADSDALQVVVPVEKTETSVEQFDISFVDSPMMAMVLAWDTTKIVVPIMK
ncbi:MAG: DUF2911 domain-containing protein [Bacteroidota bacterium]